METTQLELIGGTSNTAPKSSTCYAQVLVNVEAKVLNSKIFTYKIPDELRNDVHVGTPVLVPFGRLPEVTGFVVSLLDEYTEAFTLKEITDILDETPLFDADYFSFLHWVADETATPLTQVLACALPANMVRKTRRLFRLNDAAEINTAMSLPEKKIIEFLKANPRAYT